MKKRLEFQCWNCKKTYTLFREISDEQILFVACPFCNKEGVVDLKPFRKEKKSVLRGDSDNKQIIDIELQLPKILPTKQSE